MEKHKQGKVSFKQQWDLENPYCTNFPRHSRSLSPLIPKHQ